MCRFCPSLPWVWYKSKARSSNAGYDGVMMQAALDMQSGIVLDPMAEFKALGQDPDPGDEAAIGVTGLTLSVKQGTGKAAYAPACTDTDAVGMACEQVTGLHLLSPAVQSIDVS